MKTITIKDVLHFPKLKANLLLVRHLVLKRLHVQFGHEGSFVLSPSQEKVAIIHEVNSLYQIKFSKVHGVESAALVQSSANYDKLALWHRQLGHLNVKNVQALHSMISGMDLSQSRVVPSSFICEVALDANNKSYRSQLMVKFVQPTLWSLCILMYVAQ